jgi:hypothetical protein
VEGIRVQPPSSSLADQVLALTERLAAVESRLSALEARGPASAGESADYDILPPVEVPRVDALRLTTALGRSLIVLGGAYLLRALTDAGTWPPAVGVSLGMVYALSWIALADRAASAGDRVRAIFDGGTAFVIGFPLIAEATFRFGLFTPETGGVMLTAFTAVALVAAYRARLHSLAWMVTIGGMMTVLTLMVRLGVVAPYSVSAPLRSAHSGWATCASGSSFAGPPVCLPPAACWVSLRARSPCRPSTRLRAPGLPRDCSSSASSPPSSFARWCAGAR